MGVGEHDAGRERYRNGLSHPSDLVWGSRGVGCSFLLRYQIDHASRHAPAAAVHARFRHCAVAARGDRHEISRVATSMGWMCT